MAPEHIRAETQNILVTAETVDRAWKWIQDSTPIPLPPGAVINRSRYIAIFNGSTYQALGTRDLHLAPQRLQGMRFDRWFEVDRVRDDELRKLIYSCVDGTGQ